MTMVYIFEDYTFTFINGRSCVINDNFPHVIQMLTALESLTWLAFVDRKGLP